MSTCSIGLPICSEKSLPLPGDAGVSGVLHEKERRLSMMDARQRSAAVGDLSLVDRLGQRLAARLAERRLDLPSDALELRVGQGETQVRAREIGERLDLFWIAFPHHDCQRVGDVGHGGAGQQTLIDQGVHSLQAGKIGVGLRRPRHVAGADAPACLQLLNEQTGRDRLPVDAPPILGMSGLERSHERAIAKK